ncbi:hypothetical protein SELMODRAFT_422228 [Selaginella moellendorffii]|uniref:Uncharacterized protein n=1 Tax=Selaginella moellendorffii TaxID=88036 RepID=D8SHS8_SELML|nr:hypothetical protein SELMODRAFT_422228 [Selaginella moellendorffii]
MSHCGHYLEYLVSLPKTLQTQKDDDQVIRCTVSKLHLEKDLLGLSRRCLSSIGYMTEKEMALNASKTKEQACAAQAEKEAGVDSCQALYQYKAKKVEGDRAGAQGHYDTDMFVGKDLLELYAKCGSKLKIKTN